MVMSAQSPPYLPSLPCCHSYPLPVQRAHALFESLEQLSTPPCPLCQGWSSNLICWAVPTSSSSPSAHSLPTCYPGFQIPELADALWPQAFIQKLSQPQAPTQMYLLVIPWQVEHHLMAAFLRSQHPTWFLHSSHYFW